MILHRHSYRYRISLGLRLDSHQPQVARYQAYQGVFIDLEEPHYSHLLHYTPLRAVQPLQPLKHVLLWLDWTFMHRLQQRNPFVIIGRNYRCFPCREAPPDSNHGTHPLKTVIQAAVQSWSKAILVLDLQLEYSCSVPLRHFLGNTLLLSAVIFLAPYMANFLSLLKLQLLRPSVLPFLNLFTGTLVRPQSSYGWHECLVLQNEDWYHLHW